MKVLNTIIWAIIYFLLVFLAQGCKQKGKAVNIQEILVKLKSSNIDQIKDAICLLNEDDLTVQESVTILQAAAWQFPTENNDTEDICAQLVQAAVSKPKVEYIPVIRELFAEYSDNGRQNALRALAEMQTRDAAQTYMAILKKYGRSNMFSSLSTKPLQENPCYADVYFPDILEYTDIEAFEWDIYYMTLCYFEQKQISVHDIGEYQYKLLDSYGKYKINLMPKQQSEGYGWIWEDEYQGMREKTALILDVMGYCMTPEIEKELQEALSYRDARLKFYPAIALIRQNKPVSNEIIYFLASDPEMRILLYEELEKLHKQHLFPLEFKTQKAFAESDMINWLIYPTELGRMPDAIELMKIVTQNSGSSNEIMDYYVFRFRTTNFNDEFNNKWLTGISGPYVRQTEPSTRPWGETFSTFEPWESKTPEEHVKGIQELLAKTRSRYKNK